MKTLNLVIVVFLINMGFISCDKEEPVSPIIGDYQFVGLSIDNEDATDWLKNDTINLKGLSIAGEKGYYQFVLYIYTNTETDFIYNSRYKLSGSSLKVTLVQWEHTSDLFLETNKGIFPFSKQDVVYLDYSKPAENKLILTTEFSEQKYTYEFKK